MNYIRGNFRYSFPAPSLGCYLMLLMELTGYNASSHVLNDWRSFWLLASLDPRGRERGK